MRLLLALVLMPLLASGAGRAGDEGCSVPGAELAGPAPAGAAEAAALTGPAFVQAVARLRVDEHEPAALFPVLERCLQEGLGTMGSAEQRAAWAAAAEAGDMEDVAAGARGPGACSAVAESLARRGAAADRDRLFGVFDELAPGAALREAIVSGALQARLQAAAEEGVPSRAAGSEPFLPPANGAADMQAGSEGAPGAPGPAYAVPDDMQDLYRQAAADRERYLAALERLRGDDPPSFMADHEAFFAAVADYLRGRVGPGETARRVGGFTWGSWCGTGAETFTRPQVQVMLLALFDLGEVELARGALLAAVGHLDGHLDGRSAADSGVTWVRLAERLGVDWEGLVAGSLFDWPGAPAQLLARHGSDRGVRLLLRALDQPGRSEGSDESLGEGPAMLANVAMLVEPGSWCDEPSGLDTTAVPRTGPALGADVQQQALLWLAGQARDERGLDVAAAAALQLRSLCRPETLASLQAMATSRYASVRAPAVEALRSLGAPVPRLPRPRPIRLHLHVDGGAWGGKAVESVLSRRESWTSSSPRTDAAGVLELERDVFLDLRRPVQSVRISTPSLAPGRDTWFSVEQQERGALDRPRTISLRTQWVHVVLPPAAAGACASAPCVVQLEAEGPLAWDPDTLGFDAISGPQPLEPGGRWSVRLQRGRSYRARVSGRGGQWTSPVLVPGEQPVTLALRGDALGPLEDAGLEID